MFFFLQLPLPMIEVVLWPRLRPRPRVRPRPRALPHVPVCNCEFAPIRGLVLVRDLIVVGVILIGPMSASGSSSSYAIPLCLWF